MLVRGKAALWAGVLLAVLAAPLAAAQPPALSNSLTGGTSTYTVQRGDSLTRVGARFGMEVPDLAALNGLETTAWLKIGQVLRIRNPHIAPPETGDGVVINIPQKMLFYFSSGKVLGAYPAGLGRRNWPTPSGEFDVVSKERNKTWIVPESIQEEMVAKGLPLRKKVPPGPENPLGNYWIRISSDTGIHGTNAPASIYHFQTHGCIRLLTKNIARLFQEVSVGTPVRITYQPVLLARLPDGKFYLEVHPDIYRKAGDALETVRRMAEAAGADSMIDWQKVHRVVRERRGLAEDVSLPAGQTARGIS